ncbi:PIN domain-containing protein [Methylopila sp. M107]|uniref:PIN domain-containing protein n=1 Tax=Methylopila sp. M107 TaxID=1101190 RepID=UPI000367E59B|nr:PIN domain-containing protein [Methylopila sp. M107]
MRIAVDSNVLLYAEGLNDAERMAVARDVLDRIPKRRGVVSVQALGECFQLLTRKGGRDATGVREMIAQWSRVYDTQETSIEVFSAAVEIAARHKLQIWDSVILAAAAEANCTILLSEDMQSGFRWRDVTIVNPFSPQEHPLLTAALDPA